MRAYMHVCTHARMTGLDDARDRLLEVACIITDGDLRPIDDGVNYVIHTDPHVLEAMDEWCVSMSVRC